MTIFFPRTQRRTVCFHWMSLQRLHAVILGEDCGWGFQTEPLQSLAANMVYLRFGSELSSRSPFKS